MDDGGAQEMGVTAAPATGHGAERRRAGISLPARVALTALVAAVAALLAYQAASRFMVAEAEKQVENVLLTHRGLHHYIQRVMHPEFYRARDASKIALDYYAPEILSSSFMARELHAFYNEERAAAGLAPIYYKMAAENPRNEANRADASEVELIRLFNTRRDLKEVREIVESGGQRYLRYAIPFLETKEPCLRCHGRREESPAGLQALYPGAGGYDDEVGRIRAVESIRAPLQGELQVAATATAALTAAVLAFGGLFLFNGQLRRRVRLQTLSLQGEVRDRTRAEADAQLLKDELVAVVDSMPAIIAALDADGRVTHWNRGAVEATGRAVSEVVGLPVTSILPDLAEPIEALRGEVMAGGKAARRERLTVAPLGVRRQVDVALYPLAGAEGRGAVLRVDDVTTQVEIEANLAQAQKLEAIGTLSGGIAHDFNNILTAILGTADAALADAKDPVAREDLQSIRESARRAGELVRRILAFSRRASESEVPCDPSETAREALRLLRATVPSSVEIRARLVSTLEVMADPGDLLRILVNLGTNASIAMRGQSGLLEIVVEDRATGEVPEAGDGEPRPHGWILITVTDDGCGMGPEIRDRIFEPFFTTRREEGGTGLGLSVVHGIVKRLGGRIRLDTAPGEGTLFEILLPGREPSGASTAAPEAQAEGSERVLFVDDEAALAANAERTLTRLGYRVSTFTRAAEALSAFRAAPLDFDVLITDLTMPGMTGDALIRKARESRPDVPTILCTGFSERFDEEQARALGVDRFAMKPVVGAEIARLVRELMDRP